MLIGSTLVHLELENLVARKKTSALGLEGTGER